MRARLEKTRQTARENPTTRSHITLYTDNIQSEQNKNKLYRNYVLFLFIFNMNCKSLCIQEESCSRI